MEVIVEQINHQLPISKRLAILFAACLCNSSNERGRNFWQSMLLIGSTTCLFHLAIVSRLCELIAEGNIVFASMTEGASASFGAMVNHGKSRSLTIIEEVNDDH